jgi:hypothetical protein
MTLTTICNYLYKIVHLPLIQTLILQLLLHNGGGVKLAGNRKKKKEKKRGEQENVKHKCNTIINSKELYIYYPNPLEFAVSSITIICQLKQKHLQRNMIKIP